MGEQPFVSIVMPVYKVRNYIGRSLDSCLSQTDHDFEVVAIDDCGNDGSMDIVQSYKKDGLRVNIICNDRNIGTYHARKAGVEHSLGHVVLFLDPDDELTPNAVSLIKQFYSTRDPDILLCDVSFLPARKWFKKTAYLFCTDRHKQPLRSIYSSIRREFVWGGTPGKVYKRSFLLSSLQKITDFSYFRFVFMEDNYLFYSSVVLCTSIDNLKEKIYIYYKNTSSITMVESEDQKRENIDQYQTFIDLLSNTCEKYNTKPMERELCRKLINFHKANLLLISRKSSSESYFFSLYNSMRHDLKLRKLVALLVFFSTFGKVKL